jgi:Zn-dependent protease
VELTPDALACPNCHILLHARALESLSNEAKSLEAGNRIGEAQEQWTRALALLPHESRQAEWVREHLKVLATRQTAVEESRQQAHPWAKKLGPFAPLLIVLLKAKGLLLALIKLKFLFSFFVFFSVYGKIYGWRLGAGFAVSILIHEMGHFIEIRRRGLAAEVPVFLPGLGAFVQMKTAGVGVRPMARIGLAGPFAGMLAAAFCAWQYTHTHDLFWLVLARLGAILNLLNLVPVWILDGSKATAALGRMERVTMLCFTLLCWYWTGEGLFFVVAAGCGYRLFTKDIAVREDWADCFFFAAVMGALAVILKLAPESLAGMQS